MFISFFHLENITKREHGSLLFGYEYKVIVTNRADISVHDELIPQNKFDALPFKGSVKRSHQYLLPRISLIREKSMMIILPSVRKESDVSKTSMMVPCTANGFPSGSCFKMVQVLFLNCNIGSRSIQPCLL